MNGLQRADCAIAMGMSRVARRRHAAPTRTTRTTEPNPMHITEEVVQILTAGIEHARETEAETFDVRVSIEAAERLISHILEPRW